MTKLLLKNLLSPLSIVMAVWIALSGSGASANESTTTSKSLAATNLEPTAEEIETTSQATEIKPGDWAYQTLQALGSKYSCAATPDGKTLSREEFATSLNGCVQSIEQLVARRKVRKFKKRRSAPPAPSVVTPPPAEPEVLPPPPEPTPVVPPAPVEPEVSQQDLDRIRQLVQSFSTELQAVDSRVRELDAKVTKVKDQSFSTTTKLVGEAIFAVNGLAGGPSTASRNTIFADRVRLNFRSSFTGKDLLLVRLQSRNTNSFGGAVATSASGTNMTRFGFEGSEENATYVSRLQYQLPLSATSKVYIETVGNEFNDNYYNFNPELQAAGTGAVTRFGRFNPVYRLSNEGAGIGVDTKLSPNLGLVLSYAVPKLPIAGVTTETVNNPNSGSGLFNGSNVIFSQLTLKPSDDVSLGLIYARTYTTNGTVLSGNTGSNFANNPFNGVPTSGNHYSVLGSVNLSKNLVLSAWGGLTQANREATGGGSADIWNYAATLAVKDFGSKGSTLGFVVGMQPKVTSNTTTTRVDRDTSLHLETFYKYKVSDNLYITPGLLLLTNPEHNAGNPTEYLGTVRTTFVF
jgi:Carbohydrate-selective porin, OprB family